MPSSDIEFIDEQFAFLMENYRVILRKDNLIGQIQEKNNQHQKALIKVLSSTDTCDLNYKFSFCNMVRDVLMKNSLQDLIRKSILVEPTVRSAILVKRNFTYPLAIYVFLGIDGKNVQVKNVLTQEKTVFSVSELYAVDVERLH